METYKKVIFKTQYTQYTQYESVEIMQTYDCSICSGRKCHMHDGDINHVCKTCNKKDYVLIVWHSVNFVWNHTKYLWIRN